MPQKFLFLSAVIFVALWLSGCSSSGDNGAGIAAQNYFQAIASGDEDTIATLSCPDWESAARADVAAFKGVKARLENVTCTPISGSGKDSQESVVECTGAIVATYNNEDSNFELKGKQLKVVNQGGEWLVCGYAQ